MWEPFAKVGEITLNTLSSFEITPNDVLVDYLSGLVFDDVVQEDDRI